MSLFLRHCIVQMVYRLFATVVSQFVYIYTHIKTFFLFVFVFRLSDSMIMLIASVLFTDIC